MSNKKQKSADFSVIVPKGLKGYKKQQRNLLGYIMFRYSGYSRQRAENEDWFFMSNSDLLQASGIGSKTTLYLYIRQFISNGVIEMMSGDRHHANMYRLTEQYQDHKFDYRPVEKCTTDIIDIEGDNEKSVPPTESVLPTAQNDSESVLPTTNKKCTTDIVDIEGDNEKSVPQIESRAEIQKCTTDKDKETEIIDNSIKRNSILDNTTHKQNLLLDNVKSPRENEGNNCVYCENDPKADRPIYEPEKPSYNDKVQAQGNNTENNTETMTNQQTKVMSDKFWQSWRRYTEKFAELTPEDAARYYKTYESKLYTIYNDATAKTLARRLQSEYQMLRDGKTEAETDNSTTPSETAPKAQRIPLEDVEEEPIVGWLRRHSEDAEPQAEGNNTTPLQSVLSQYKADGDIIAVLNHLSEQHNPDTIEEVRKTVEMYDTGNDLTAVNNYIKSYGWENQTTDEQ